MPIELSCEYCGARLSRSPSQVRPRNFCSHSCRNRVTKRGAQNWKWKGGAYIQAGYRFIQTPAGYVQEHRVIMERTLGRPLTDRERVHHVNGDILDNRPENLQLMPSQSEHGKHHAEEFRRTTWGWAGLGHGCIDCGQTERPHYAHGLCTRCVQRVKWRHLQKSKQASL